MTIKHNADLSELDEITKLYPLMVKFAIEKGFKIKDARRDRLAPVVTVTDKVDHSTILLIGSKSRLMTDEEMYYLTVIRYLGKFRSDTLHYTGWERVYVSEFGGSWEVALSALEKQIKAMNPQSDKKEMMLERYQKTLADSLSSKE